MYNKTTAQVFNIKNMGAIGDGKTINTAAIQLAIDSCAVRGGKVVVPKGVFLSGSLYLKSNVALQVEEGGTLKGSPYFKDYPVNNVVYKNAFTHNFDGSAAMTRAFIFAEGASNIVLTGKGTINGSGDAVEFNLGNDDTSLKSKQRPCMLLFINCKNIKVDGLSLMNSAYWLQNYIGCDGVNLCGLKIYNHTNYNQDGIDIDARNVLIENCSIDVDDDGMCFKSHERKNVVENIVVRNCKIASNCNAIKFGTTSIGGFKNVRISNCSISKASADHIRHWQQNLKFIGLPITVISGIALEAVDGANIENINISEIDMTDVQTPIFIVLGNRSRKPVGDTSYRAGTIKNVILKNISAKSYSKMCSSITGFPGHNVRDIILENVVLEGMGEGAAEEAVTNIPENERAYPENRMYGLVYPASGFYLRHVTGVAFKNVIFTTKDVDYRPSLVMEDASSIALDKVRSNLPAGNLRAIRIINGKDILIKKLLVPGKSEKIEMINMEPKALIPH